ncbi:hypothetical protein [Microbacterium sp. SORGH_AS_0888]|uniref:hypothetical protein n=1 Tax=Microbacterium sp. SORGH_AS_0888 TaxID=3041791 RepID=UPI0027832686|nr:hypothetical protein [Microbacterium sp. SORGH_AS_0888]MDQ1128739.1 hypothetical protein [Microbacterium sp. SORGH_AS_0888]
MDRATACAVARVLTLVKDIVNKIVEFVMTSSQKLESFRAAASDVSGTDFGSWPVARLA